MARSAARSLLASLTMIACAPIDVTTTHTLQPRAEPTLALGEQLVDRHFEVDWVQLGPRVLVELREARVCAEVTHRPVMRIEQVERKARGFIAWDFALAGLTGGLSALAFARPQSFSRPLIDNQGRYLIDPTAAYVTGAIFAGVALVLLSAGVVNSIKARDETRYAAAYELELGPEHPCLALAERPVATRELELAVADRAIVVTATSDAQGRARFELPATWPEGVALPDEPTLPASLTIADELRSLTIDLRVPWWIATTDAHTGRADTREGGPSEGPREPESAGASE